MHKTSISSALSLSLACSLAAAGCSDDPPSSAEVRGRLTSDLGNVLRESSTAVANSSEALPGAGTLSVIDRVLGTNTTVAARMRSLTAKMVAPGQSATAPDTDAQVEFLNENLFSDANHVGNGVYKIPAALVCTDITFDAKGNPIETLDQACADQLDKLELRVRTELSDDALVFALQLDKNHDEPLSLELTHTSIALTTNLDDAQRALVALSSALGVPQPNAEIAGQVTAKLEVLGSAKVKTSLSIDRALSIKIAEDGASLDGPDAFVLSSAKSEVLALTLDGTAKSGSLAMALGETVVKSIDELTGKRTALDLPGLSATASFSPGKPFALTNLSLGSRTTTVSVDGQIAQSIDLNPQDGRRLDLTVTRDAATQSEVIAVSPKLDLRMTTDHALLGDEAELYDVTRVLLDGSLRTSDVSDQIEVVTGTFGITTNPLNYGFAAPEGQCVMASDAFDPDTGAFTRWTVADCF